MIFISIIVTGYMTLVINDQRQTSDNELSASALAAARSGVEEGKRIIIYCQNHTADPNCSSALLNSADNCDVFKSGNPGANLAPTLQIPIDPTTGQGATAGADQYQQYFTCLTIQQDTPYTTATVNQDSSYIQRLKTTQPFNQLVVSWSGKGTYANRTTVNGWTPLTSWKDTTSGNPYAPVIELQIIPYALTDFANLDGLEQQTRTVYIAPCTLVGEVLPPSCITSQTAAVLDQRGAAGSLRSGSVPIMYGGCTTSGSAGYECVATLTGFNGGGPSSAQQYYVRASVLYAASTTLKLSPLDSSSNSVLFNNVQPWIDVTGRTNDVFKRVRAQVSYTQSTGLPRYSVDSAAPVCKDMTVTNDAASSTYNCN